MQQPFVCAFSTLRPLGLVTTLRQTTGLLAVTTTARGSAHMTHRHYGAPVPKPRPAYSGPTRAAAWSGSAIFGGIIASVIVLGFVVYEVSKIVAYADNTATSAPRTTGDGYRPPTALR
jgi:hypothetical protein